MNIHIIPQFLENDIDQIENPLNKVSNYFMRNFCMRVYQNINKNNGIDNFLSTRDDLRKEWYKQIGLTTMLGESEDFKLTNFLDFLVCNVVEDAIDNISDGESYLNSKNLSLWDLLNLKKSDNPATIFFKEYFHHYHSKIPINIVIGENTCIVNLSEDYTFGLLIMNNFFKTNANFFYKKKNIDLSHFKNYFMDDIDDLEEKSIVMMFGSKNILINEEIENAFRFFGINFLSKNYDEIENELNLSVV